MALTNIVPAALYFNIKTVFTVLSYLLLGVLFIFININPLWKKRAFSRMEVLLSGSTLIEMSAVTTVANTALSIVYGFKLLPHVMSV